MEAYNSFLNKLHAHVHPIVNKKDDFDPLLELIGDASFVLLGEASHGTHEFYKTRAEITKRLIQEKNFNIIALEADWPDAYKINRYVHSELPKANAFDAISEFKRFPAWMWRNTEMLEFIEWLYNYNKNINSKTNIYGLDLYSLHRSMQAVISSLLLIDPKSAEQAKKRYACFDSFGLEAQQYGYFATLYPDNSCKSQVEQQLVDLIKRSFSDIREAFYTAQNARVVKNAEHYYRSLFEGGPADSWNVRDRHMMETLEAICAYYEKSGKKPKVIVWAHNSHLGDARATQISSYGEINLGQLVKERHGKNAISIGFTTHNGTVSAASEWGGDVERKRVRPALAGSYEQLFHDIQVPKFLLLTKANPDIEKLLAQERLERAIGVIYQPNTERASHYFYASLSEQFDAIIHFDTTSAVEPLEKSAGWLEDEMPETFPTGI